MAEAGLLDRRTAGVLRLLRQIGPFRLLIVALLLAGAFFVARYSWSLPLIGDAERALYDLRFVYAADRVEQLEDVDKRVTLVTYTDETLLALQKRSPLDRRTLAQALLALDAMGPKAIAIDILFDQPQAEDEELIAALRSMRTPTYVAFTTSAANPEQMNFSQEQYLREFMARAATDKVRPIAIRIDPDPADGVMRRWPARQPDLPPLLANALVPDRADMATYEGAIAYRVQATGSNDTIPPFPKIPIETFSVAGSPDLPPEAREALLSAPELRGQIRDRYVLIGGDIQSTDDFETPISRLTPMLMKGLEVHAQMVRQLLDGEARPELSPWLLWLAALLVVVAGAVTGLFELRSWWLGVGLAVQLGLIALLPFYLETLDMGTLTLPAAGWGAGWLLAFLGAGLAARAIGYEQRRFAHSALGRFLPADIAKQILRDPDQLKLTGEKKQIYAMFTDLEGFTSLSHAIRPERLSILLNAYLDRLSDTVLEHGGTIDKFVGDAVVAFWGAPIARSDDGERAARAALAMFEAGEAFRRDTDPDLAIGRTRVGLHKGEAVVGNFGGDKRIQYTALGDSMNTAARLESANKLLHTTILVSREAMLESGLDCYRPMGRIVLWGRATPVEVWEPKPDMEEPTRRELQALWERYDAGDRAALAGIEGIAGNHPEDAALQNFVLRIREVGPGGDYVLGTK
jgi:adenylate cyclase